MRDLGLMGENLFSSLCAEEGLVANKSKIDKTGWDFLVEFPFDSGLSSQTIHKSAFECKVQVKSSDKASRKLSIKLSNLRRLATAQLPAFFVFFEFDGMNNAQRLFVVHVDNDLIAKVIKRIHEIEGSSEQNKFNKRTMTIRYDETNLIEEVSGVALRARFLEEIGNDVAEYIASKKSHLESVGYEKGSAKLTFTTTEEQFETLIDVSLGIKQDVEISNVQTFDVRFGVDSQNSPLYLKPAKLSMPDIKPKAGIVRFRADIFSPWMSFDARLYISPFNQFVKGKLQKWRIEGEFFDITLNLDTGVSHYSANLGDGIKLEINRFKNAIKLINLFHSATKPVFAELIFGGLPALEFTIGPHSGDQDFNLASALSTLESSIKIISDFAMTDTVDISLDEIYQYEEKIRQMESVLFRTNARFTVKFEIVSKGYEIVKTACIFFTGAPIESHVFGVLFVLTGYPEVVEGKKYQLTPENVIIEQKIVLEKDKLLSAEDFDSAMKNIREKYENEFSVITLQGNEGKG